MKIINDIKLVTMEEMRVISFHGYGKGPEEIAWQNLRTWITENGHEELVETQRFFGFNNPNPSPGSENYGYEQWMTLPAAYEKKEGETIKSIPGGLYAVGGFRSSSPEAFGPTWQVLNNWRVDSEYIYDEGRQWMEELLTKESVLVQKTVVDFDCFMPVMKVTG